MSYLSPCWRIKLPANSDCGMGKLGSFTLFCSPVEEHDELLP